MFEFQFNTGSLMDKFFCKCNSFMCREPENSLKQLLGVSSFEDSFQRLLTVETIHTLIV